MAAPGQSLKMRITEFQKRVRTLSKIIIHQDDLEHFSAAKPRVTRLYTLGITNSTTAIRWLPAIPEKIAKTITRIIMQTIMPMNLSRTMLLDAGRLAKILEG